jgi:SAM-dependent methyltransferase
MIGPGLRRAVRYGLLRLPPRVRSRVEIRLLRAYEAYLGWRGNGREPAVDPAGRPLPPPALRILVSGTADPAFFLDTGRRQAELFRRLLEPHAGSMEDMSAILDFGCGCGRIARWWADLPGPAVFGCDPNRQLVHWCRAHLPFLNAATSEDEPPLPYPDASFDFAYALSIFTHLPAERAGPWMAELRRVLRPGGHLLFTTAGEAYRDRLSPAEADRYARGEEVVQFDTAAGTNLCIVYHSPDYVRNRMLDGFELVETFITPEHPEEAREAGLPQDAYLVRVPPAPDAR